MLLAMVGVIVAFRRFVRDVGSLFRKDGPG